MSGRTYDRDRWVTIVHMPDRIVQTAVREEHRARDLAERFFTLIDVTEVTVDFITNYQARTQTIRVAVIES